MTILISLILAVPAVVLWNSDRLASWLCIGAIVLLLFFGMASREEARAQVNWTTYWANYNKRNRR